jgi:hypothetical protein
MKKLILSTLVFYVICLVVLLVINGAFIEQQSFGKMMGFVLSSMVYMSFLSVIYFFIVRFFLKKKMSLGFSMILFGFILNLPFLSFAILAVGKAFQRSEAILFSVIYILVGSYFGFLFYKYHMTHGVY